MFSDLNSYTQYYGMNNGPFVNQGFNPNNLNNGFDFRTAGMTVGNNDEIISTGYNGAPRGRKNCCDLKSCLREELQVPRGERYELCRSVHAEQNAIISASRKDMLNGTLYLVGINYNDNTYVQNANPCALCKKMIINAGLKQVIVRDTKESFRIIDIQDFIDNDESLEESKGY